MSGDWLLLFVDGLGQPQGWLRLRDGTVAERGGGDALPLSEPPLPVAVIVPGEAVTVHWLELPAGLAPAQAAAAARLLAAEVSAQPLGDMHVAVGRATEGAELRAVALVPALTMTQWLTRLEPFGIDPELVIPDTLLLPVPDEGFVRFDAARPRYRARAEAFAMEPELAELVVGAAPVRVLDTADFEAGLAAALDAPELNLRQGYFARRRRWTIDWPTVRRLAGLAVAILLVTLAIQLVLIWRYTAAADAAEAELRRSAGIVLPGGATPADPGALLAQRLADARGGNYAALAAPLFEAVRATPGVALAGLDYDRSGSLRASLQADIPAGIASLIARLEGAGLAVQPGISRQAGGKTVQDLVVRPR